MLYYFNDKNSEYFFSIEKLIYYSKECIEIKSD